MTYDHAGQLTIDAPEGYSECVAVYRVYATWSARNRKGYRTIEDAHCTLKHWTFNGRPQTRSTAIALMGEKEVQRQEDLALSAWEEKAPQEDAEGWADYQSDLKADR